MLVIDPGNHKYLGARGKTRCSQMNILFVTIYFVIDYFLGNRVSSMLLFQSYFYLDKCPM